MFKTLEDVQKYCAENQIVMVDFKMTDLDGRWRHITIPIERFTEDTMEYGIGFDGSNYGYAPVENSDMVFIPDLSSVAIDPFMEVPTLTMIGDVKIIAQPSNKDFDQYPRNVVKHAEEYMRECGIADEMMIGPEFEFHVFDRAAYQVQAENTFYQLDSTEAQWHSGAEGPNNGYHVGSKDGYHICAPKDVAQDLRSRICLKLAERGVDIKYHHMEVGNPGQMEIEVELGTLSQMADATMLIKYMVKNEAVREGRTATFMPKPVYAQAGNGMHVHMLLMKDGKPLFYDENGYAGLSETAMFFMGGLLKHAPSLCAFTNPTTNSYKRLVPGFEAPVTIGYATSNRSAVIRIPAYAKSPSKKRFELRSPDATCNPYFTYAAILMAGIDGIKNRIDPSANGWGPYDFNLFTLPKEELAKIQSLPSTLEGALQALEADHEYLLAGGVFPKRLIEIWIDRKRAEGRKIEQIPHPAEFAAYYDL